MNGLKFSFFQLTFGQEETYKTPENTYKRLKKNGYDAIELTPPKGRFGLGISMEEYARTHRRLRDDFELDISCINECWGASWDPYSPEYKALTEEKTANKAVEETKTTIDLANEVGALFVTVATAIHRPIDKSNVNESTLIAVGALKQMCDYAQTKGIRLVFEATNHLEMGKYVNTIENHKRLIEKTGADNLGVQIDWFHANFEELNPYEAVILAQPLLWHMHFRDSNSLTPGFGTVDFKAVIRAIKRTNYDGYCTIESSPMVPTPELACKLGIEYLKMMEKIADYQLTAEYPNGFAV